MTSGPKKPPSENDDLDEPFYSSESSKSTTSAPSKPQQPTSTKDLTPIFEKPQLSDDQIPFSDQFSLDPFHDPAESAEHLPEAPVEFATDEAPMTFSSDEAPPSFSPPEDSPIKPIESFSDAPPVPPPFDSAQHPIASQGIPHIAASFPFSLQIDGILSEVDQVTLMNILSQENMGIREVDLEPQLRAGKILIPRISEFAGILIAQALRDSGTHMRLAPADEIFATDDTRTTADDLIPFSMTENQSESFISDELVEDLYSHPAEKIPMTSGSIIPGLENYQIIDAISASAVLQTYSVEATQSTEYAELVERLQKEVKYRAYHKKANGVIHFSISLTRLSLPENYRLTALGTAIKLVSKIKS